MDESRAHPSVQPPETAASHLVRRVPTARADECVRDVIARLAGREWDALDTVWIVDAAARLEGRVALARLFAARPDRSIRELDELGGGERVGVAPSTDQEHVAEHALRNELDSVPVVAGDGTLLGVVPPRALLGVLRREHVEDLHRLSGIVRESDSARHALDDPPARRARHRLPWLIAGLAGASGSALLTASYADELRARVALTFFIPAIVYLADAIGTQTEAIAVRFLSISPASFPRLFAGELRTGVWIGAVLSMLAFPIASWAAGDVRLGAAVALSLFVAGALATAIGSLLPWGLARIGLDPAFGSGPIATILQDVLSLYVYLSIASRIVV